MNKEQQDKLWNELSEESKKKIQDDWQMLQRAKANNDLSFYGVGKQDLYQELFGSHNLNPTLTYEDVVRELFFDKKGFYIDSDGRIDEMILDKQYNVWKQVNNCTSRKQAEKLLAINKLLNVCVWADMRNELSIEISAELREKINSKLTDKEFELIISNDY